MPLAFWFQRRYLNSFTIYRLWGHLSHVTITIYINFDKPIIRSLHMKFEFNWPSGFRGEDVWKCWRTPDGRTDGRRSHWYTISSAMSLGLKWAKKSVTRVSTSFVGPDLGSNCYKGCQQTTCNCYIAKKPVEPGKLQWTGANKSISTLIGSDCFKKAYLFLSNFRTCTLHV